jgi:hypothetical protein
VDGKSNFWHIYLQSSTNAEHTLAAKHDFERRAKTFGREIRTYHGDNGCFVEHVFQKDHRENKQSLSVCGVGGQLPSSKFEHCQGPKPSHLDCGHSPSCTPTTFWITFPGKTAPHALASLLEPTKSWTWQTDTLWDARFMFSKIPCKPQ